jgi:hypothetical protein
VNNCDKSVNDENIYRRSVLITHKCQSDENIVLKHVEKLVNALTLSQTRFEDQTFPASSYSLYINGHSFSKSTLALLPTQEINSNCSSVNDHIQWLRPDQIKPPEWNHNKTTEWTVFRDPKPNDVFQGALGNRRKNVLPKK